MSDLPKSEISFDASLGPEERAIPLINVFLRVAEATDINSSWRGGLALLWATAVLRNNTKDAYSALLPLTEIKWEWPDFDTMRDWLVRDDRWPTPWHHYASAAKDRRKMMKVERVKIFAATLTAAARSQRLATDDFIDALKSDGWTLTSDSEVALPYIEALKHRINPDDWRTWPPLYPGDQSMIRIGG